MAKQAKQKLSGLDRSIMLRERGIERMKDNQKSIMDEARARCEEIDKRIAEKRVLLDALKRGAITS